MNLLEIHDEFAEPKGTPEQDLAALEKKRKSLDHNIQVLRDRTGGLRQKIVGPTIAAPWEAKKIGQDNEAIKKQVDQGFTYTTHINTWDGTEHIDYYYPDISQNKKTIEMLKILAKRLAHSEKTRDGLNARVKRAKGRLSAWKRKQPTYVGRATGKELLKDLREKVEQVIVDNKLPVNVTNAYYWTKNKMIVIEISCRTSTEGLTVNNFAKQKVKPMFDAFLSGLGYTQFRCTDRFVMAGLTIIKIQLDDVEAKNKATEHAPQ